eukprot:scaffold10523_cov57-Phaeocystis_antarctica.AAC.2
MRPPLLLLLRHLLCRPHQRCRHLHLLGPAPPSHHKGIRQHRDHLCLRERLDEAGRSRRRRRWRRCAALSVGVGLVSLRRENPPHRVCRQLDPHKRAHAHLRVALAVGRLPLLALRHQHPRGGIHASARHTSEASRLGQLSVVRLTVQPARHAVLAALRGRQPARALGAHEAGRVVDPAGRRGSALSRVDPLAAQRARLAAAAQHRRRLRSLLHGAVCRHGGLHGAACLRQASVCTTLQGCRRART